MKIISITLSLALLTIRLYGQECFIDSTKENIKFNYGNIWIDNTYQGTIGDNNQRIEIRFIKITKKTNDTYLVIGKSKVNSKICDFQGTIKIQKILIIDKSKNDCIGSSFLYNIISGSYHFKEDSTKKNVGDFIGRFETKYNKTSMGFEVFRDLYTDEKTNDFIGEWKGYNESFAKYCSWGIQIPPTKNNDLFIYRENEFYTFNLKFLDNGWKSYVIANFNSFIILNFDTIKPRNDKLINEFTEIEIEKNKKIENLEWWK
jgi:hypothetical protein